jgi:hypothetical protein
MDTNTTQTGSDDQELAKVLAGVNEQIEKDQAANTPTGLHFGDNASNGTSGEPMLPPLPPLPSITPNPGSLLPPIPPAGSDPAASSPAPDPSSTPIAADAVVDPALEGIKKDALNELRPLVDKLNVSSEEKFDTYLLLLRSTDDKSLIAPAHEAAKGISDETRRAQALLDVIKEIDYLSHH